VQNTQHLAKITPSGGLMPFNSNDLYDEHLETIQVALPIFKNFGGRKKFYGQIHTVKAFEDNTYIKGNYSALFKTAKKRQFLPL